MERNLLTSLQSSCDEFCNLRKFTLFSQFSDRIHQTFVCLHSNQDREADPTFSIVCETDDGDVDDTTSDNFRYDVDNVNDDNDIVEKASTYSTAESLVAFVSMQLFIALISVHALI